MGEIINRLELVSAETLINLQVTFTVLSCIVIILYAAGICRFEKSTNRMLWPQEPTASGAEKTTLHKSGSLPWGPQYLKDIAVHIPKVALEHKTAAVTQAYGHIPQLLVFNTATSEDFVPGYYYWEDEQWECLAAASDSKTDKKRTKEQRNDIALQEIPEDVIDKITALRQDYGDGRPPL